MTEIELAERVEQASGADRLLDVLIGAAVRALPPNHPEWLKEWAGDFGPMPRISGSIAALQSNGDAACHWEAPDYTASLDAAMTLVPEGWAWTLDGGDPNCDDSASLGPIPRSGELLNPIYVAAAATPALALTAAALRARSERGA